MRVLLLKNNVAICKTAIKNIDNLNVTLYDSFQEITEEEYHLIEIPSKLNNGNWEKTDEIPEIDYLETEDETNGGRFH